MSIKTENKKGTAKRLFKIIFKVNPLGCVLVCFFIIVSAVANALGSMFVKQLIDDFIAPLLLESNPVFDGLLAAIGTMAIVYSAGVISNLVFNRMMVTISQKTLKNLRDEMFAHLQDLSVKFYDTHSHGSIMSLYTNDTDTLREFISQSLAQILSSFVTIVAIATMMIILNPLLSCMVFVWMVLMIFVSKVLSSKSSVYFKRQQQKIADLNGYINEMLNGQKVVKVFCHEDAAIETFKQKSSGLQTDASKANSMINILMPILLQLGTIQYIMIAIAGGLLAINGIGSITLGTIAAFLILSRSFSGPIGQISSQINIIITALAGANRIFSFLDEPAEKDDGNVTLVKTRLVNGTLCEVDNGEIWAWRYPRRDGSITYTPVKGEICFSDVVFGYSPDKTVLHGIDIDAKAGQKIAFVGATGAGKTTITNLINRFYDIADGKIRYDGININKIKKNHLRQSMGIVLQDTHLFSGTIADNIRYGKIDATQEEIVNASVLANAHDFIMRLPENYGTIISGDGANLSGGQRQLIAIARAAVANPPVMILDEATSSIDTRTEKLVQKGMDGLMRGRTVFVIAHRLSTVKNSDLILVLEEGKIIEKGNHSQLIAQKGKYHQLYTGGLAD